MCALRLAQKIKPSGQLLQPGCQAAPPPLGVRGVAVAVAEQAYPAGEVVEVPAQSVEGNDGGVELAAGRLMVAVGVLAASGGDQGYVAFWRGKGGGVPVDQDEAAAHRHEVGRVRLAVGDDRVRPGRNSGIGQAIEARGEPREIRGAGYPKSARGWR
jgi:hypothetical protein